MNTIDDHTPSPNIIKEFKSALKKNNSNIKEFCANNGFKYGSFRVALSKNSKMSKEFADSIYGYIGESNISESSVGENDNSNKENNAANKPIENVEEKDIEQNLMDAVKDQYPDIYKSMMDEDKVTLVIQSSNAAENVFVLNKLEEEAYDYISDIVALAGLDEYFVIATAYKENGEKLKNAFYGLGESRESVQGN